MEIVLLIVGFIALVFSAGILGWAVTGRDWVTGHDWFYIALGTLFLVVSVGSFFIWGANKRQEYRARRDAIVETCKTASFAVFKDGDYVGCIVDTNDETKEVEIVWDMWEHLND